MAKTNAYKTEIILDSTQIKKVKSTIGTMRFLYNFYISENQRDYRLRNPEPIDETNDNPESSDNSKKKKEPVYTKYEGDSPREYMVKTNPEYSKSFISAYDFDKWINNCFMPNNPSYSWIKEAVSKSRKRALCNADKAYKEFFSGKKGYPKFKKKSDQDIKCYFARSNPKEFEVHRNKIKIPTLGWVHLKEYGYIPKDGITSITSATISNKADRYFISVNSTTKHKKNNPKRDAFWEEWHKKPYSPGIGADLGLKDFLITDRDDLVFKNINKTERIKKLEKQLRHASRAYARKYEVYKKNKQNGRENFKNYNDKHLQFINDIAEGKYSHEEVTEKLELFKKENPKEFIGANMYKDLLRIQKLHARLTNIRHEYLREVVMTLVKTKPEYITIENLNVKGMMKNKHLSKSIQQQCFYTFVEILKEKCEQYNIELRQVDRFYPSSKKCSKCGTVKKDLKLKDRTYKCVNPECGLEINRDKNAGLNLKYATKYKVLVKRK